MSVQKKIIEGIKDVLLTHDYVVLPGFGGFVTQIHFSQYLVEKNILTPPGKFVSFNKQLRQNDGVLTFWLQDKLQITSELALNHITEFSDYCQQVLNTKRRLSLDELGFFYLDIENNICFEPKNDANYLLESFGLSSVILNELPELTETTKQSKVEFKDRVIEEKIELTLPRKRNYRPMAYVALAGSILFFSLATIINLNKNNGPLLSGVFNSNAISTYKAIQYPELSLRQSETDIKPYIANSNGIAVIELNETSVAVNTNPNSVATTNNTSVNTTKLTISGKFQIVLGCFSMKENAEKMLKKLKRKNVKAAITGVNSKGLYIVSCAGFNSKDDALNHLSTIKSSFPTAWILSE